MMPKPRPGHMRILVCNVVVRTALEFIPELAFSIGISDA